MNPKKIGILGSGPVGKVLAAGFVKHGYTTTLGTRDPGKLQEWLKSDGRGVRVASFEETAGEAELAVLAVGGRVAEGLVRQIAPHLTGKTVLDATNPISEAPPINGVIQYFTGPNESLMERLQGALPAAHFVKCFNSVGNPFMVDPAFPGGRPTMFICGDVAGAKAEATDILNEFGWDVADMGLATSARAIEPLAMLWCIPGLTQNQWGHAFKLLRL